MYRLRCGPAAALLAVLAVLGAAVLCGADQQQQPLDADASLSGTLDQLWTFVGSAVESAAGQLCSELETRLGDLRTELAARNRELATRHGGLDARLEQVDSQLADKMSTVQSALAAQIGELGNRLEAGQRQVADKMDQPGLAAENAKMASQNTVLAAQNTELTAQNTELAAQNTELATQNTEITTRNTELAARNTELTARNTELTAQNTELAARNTELTAQNTELTAQNTALQSQSKPLPSQQPAVAVVRDCSDLPAGTASGVHPVRPAANSSVSAYCALDTDGGGWTVIQRRADIQPRQDFTLGWQAYKDGFGHLEKEFWWGLEHLWMTTSTPDRRYELRINMEDFLGVKKYALYQNFKISPESDGYRVTATDYTGDAGDSLIGRHFGMRFTTNDKDQDNNLSANCASVFEGAWWYNGCFDSNLNGKYRSGGKSNYGAGIHWRSWKGFEYSLKAVEMKMRPIPSV